MKKEYKNPVVEPVLLETEAIMITTSAELGGVSVGNKPVDGTTPDLSSGSRGQWGNLWN